MSILVVLLGGAIACFGLVGLVAPRRVVDGLLSWQLRSRFYFAVVSRLVFGATLLATASSSRFPTALCVLGAVALAVALILAPLGPSRVDSMFRGWLGRPTGVLRAWFAAGIPFGAFLVYAGT